MTNEELNYLQQFEKNYNTALYHNYTSAIPSINFKKIVEIYEKYTNNKLYVCYHCSSSILANIKIIGRWYFEIINVKEEITDGKQNKINRRRKN